MKKTLIRVLALNISLILINGTCYSQTADETIGRLMNEQKMFELREKHQELAGQLNPMINYFARAMLSEAFNNPEKGSIAVDSLLSNEIFQQQLGLNNIAYLIYLKSGFLETQWNYTEVAGMLSSFLEQTKDFPIEKNLRNELNKSLRIANILKDHPQTTVNRPREDIEIKYLQKDMKKGLAISIPCRINGKNIPMIFDTGNPKYSVITENIAKKYNIKALVDSIPMKGIGNGYAKIGIADSLKIEGIIFRNSLFYIVDKISPVDTIPVNAVLGSELLNALGEIHILPKERKIIIPLELSPSELTHSNLIMNNRHLFVRLKQDSENILMHFDTGASTSNMSDIYFSKNKETIKKVASVDTIRIAGFGGISSHNGYVVPKLRFTLNDNSFELENISVHTENIMNQWNEDGSLGADFIQQFSKVIISYKNMFIEVEH